MVSGRRIAYSDFAVRIAPDGVGGYVSEVVLAPAGGGSRAPFVPPFDDAEIPVLLGDLQRTFHASTRKRSRHLETPAQCSRRRYDPTEVGTQLFRSLFRGKVGTAFARCRPRPGEPGLRIRLMIDPLRRDCAAIAALPWELLHEPDGDGFMGQRPLFPLVRYLEGPGAHAPQPLTGELRVLAAFCSPRDLTRIDCTAERSALERWGAIPGVQVSLLEPASFDEVRERLNGEPVHVFHFTGHGGFAGGRGTLAFERADGSAEPIGAEILTATFDEAPALRLAVINACDSGKAPRVPGADPYRGVASALIRSAVPAVVGMQFPISDRAAARFAETLYGSLAQGDPVDAAVTRGRLAIVRGADPPFRDHLCRDRTSLEWATPALHLRVHDGRLFERAEPLPATSALPPSPPPPLPLLLSSPLTAPHRPRRWPAAAGAVVLLAGLGWGTWRASRPDAPRVQTLVAGLAENGSRGAGGSAFRPAAPDSVCPPHELLPGFEWIYVPEDSLELPAGEPGGTTRLLTVPAFCIGRYEVTQEQMRSVLPGEAEPSGIEPRPDDRLPASGVSFDRAQEFLDRLNRGHRDSPYRLPTNHEWEYAARAGSTSAFSFENDANELYLHGNCRARGGTHDGFEDSLAPVGHYEPNALGLHDVHGNVWEWVSDRPEPSPGPGIRIRRGGSYKSIPKTCQFPSSSEVQGQNKLQDSGFRIVREPAAAFR